MKAKRCGKLACCVMSVTLLASERASAGPYPMEQLRVWLQDAQAGLAAVQEAITELRWRISEANALLVKLSSPTRRTKVAGVGTAAVIIQETAVVVSEARRKLADLRRELAALNAQRQAILNEIELICVQMDAWCEMDPAWCEMVIDLCGE
jgi:hypothetical protein